MAAAVSYISSPDNMNLRLTSLDTIETPQTDMERGIVDGIIVTTIVLLIVVIICLLCA